MKYLHKTYIISLSLFVLVVVISLMSLTHNNNQEMDVNYVDNDEYYDIYVFNQDGYLSKTTVVLAKTKILEKVEELLKTMIEGNTNSALLEDGFVPVLPKDTKILSTKIINDVLRIDLGGSIKDNLTERMVEALTYTFNSLDGILGVELYIDNQLVKYIPVINKALPSILTKDFGINKQYDVTSFNDINKVTIYYVGKNNEETYYVPITKYVNDKREKIEIIIDELSSNYVYETNLMSFLNSSARLINYSMKDKTLAMVFNENFFNEKLENSILEEVIYTISYSAFDNYPIDEVVFYVDDKEILKKSLK